MALTRFSPSPKRRRRKVPLAALLLILAGCIKVRVDHHVHLEKPDWLYPSAARSVNTNGVSDADLLEESTHDLAEGILETLTPAAP